MIMFPTSEKWVQLQLYLACQAVYISGLTRDENVPTDFIAEKGGYGHEEGWCKGPVYDDTVFGGPVLHPFCIGLFHLV